jgi:hypothetical protein
VKDKCRLWSIVAYAITITMYHQLLEIEAALTGIGSTAPCQLLKKQLRLSLSLSPVLSLFLEVSLSLGSEERETDSSLLSLARPLRKPSHIFLSLSSPPKSMAYVSQAVRKWSTI